MGGRHLARGYYQSVGKMSVPQCFAINISHTYLIKIQFSLFFFANIHSVGASTFITFGFSLLHFRSSAESSTFAAHIRNCYYP